MESLRHKCLIQELKKYKHHNVAADYFRYLENFTKLCSEEVDHLDVCAQKAYNKTSLLPDQKLITKCVDSSFKLNGDKNTDNFILRADDKQQRSLGVYLHPTITINDYTYRGYLDGSDVFKAICQSWDKQPSQCKKGFNGVN
jgi:hypothetical protein